MHDKAIYITLINKLNQKLIFGKILPKQSGTDVNNMIRII